MLRSSLFGVCYVPSTGNWGTVTGLDVHFSLSKLNIKSLRLLLNLLSGLSYFIINVSFIRILQISIHLAVESSLQPRDAEIIGAAKNYIMCVYMRKQAVSEEKMFPRSLTYLVIDSGEIQT